MGTVGTVHCAGKVWSGREAPGLPAGASLVCSKGTGRARSPTGWSRTHLPHYAYRRAAGLHPRPIQSLPFAAGTGSILETLQQVHRETGLLLHGAGTLLGAGWGGGGGNKTPGVSRWVRGLTVAELGRGWRTCSAADAGPPGPAAAHLASPQIRVTVPSSRSSTVTATSSEPLCTD